MRLLRTHNVATHTVDRPFTDSSDTRECQWRSPKRPDPITDLIIDLITELIPEFSNDRAIVEGISDHVGRYGAV
ncbi:hypothetical protein JCM18750_39520 [Halostagnicola bangensis]